VGEERRWREAVPLIRLHIIVEGQTEETFANDVLAPDLGEAGLFVDAHSITTGRRHGRLFRGGLVRYEHLANDLSLWMKQDQHPDSWFTTMVDLYGLPAGFPDRDALPDNLTAAQRTARLEQALAEDIGRRLNGLPVSRRFVPYIQLHEFEALLFSEPAAFLEAFPGQQMLADKLSAIRLQFDSPEDINDGPETAPSKRILGLAPDYEKPVAGLLIAKRIGLARIRQECAHFNDWITRLLALAPTGGP
jgi:hypothetical protein